jgi:hypothetical protein
MLIMSGFFQVAAKSFASALLLVLNPIWFMAHMLGDHVLYQLILVARRDHQAMEPDTNVPLSVVIRALGKLAIDFTSCAVLR